MENTNKKLKIVTGVMATLLLLSVAGGMYYRDKSRDLAEEKDRIEQKANLLLLGQSRDINNLNNRFETVQKENQSLTGKVKELNNLLNEKYAQLWELRSDNAAKIALLRDTIRTQLSQMQGERGMLTDKNLSLTSQNSTLGNQIAALNEKMQTMVPRSALTADAFRAEAIKRNEKVTAKAKKVHTLTVSCNVPPALGLEGTKEVYLSITDLQGNILMTPLRTATITAPDIHKTIPVHAVKSIDFGKSQQRVAFTIESTEDIAPGIYQASVFTTDDYLGTVEFEFRDSFWFF